MIASLTWLLVFQLIGEMLARGLEMPVPGPVIGMALLFLALTWRGGPDEEMRETARGLLQHLSLLFVPAGTGVMLHFSRLREEWPALAASLLVSTFATLAVTAWVMHRLRRPTREG